MGWGSQTLGAKTAQYGPESILKHHNIRIDHDSMQFLKYGES